MYPAEQFLQQKAFTTVNWNLDSYCPIRTN